MKTKRPSHPLRKLTSNIGCSIIPLITQTLKRLRPTRLRAQIFGLVAAFIFVIAPLRAQMLIDVDFGVGNASHKTGFAATGQATNDFWNLYRHYDPKYTPGMALVPNGFMSPLKYADGSASRMSISVSNAPGVWGNATGDSMFDTYIFSQNGSNITVVLNHLEAGRYHFYLYGHADADVVGEQNSVFTLRSGTNTFGPLAAQCQPGWKAAQTWQERQQFVVFRDIAVKAGEPVTIEVAPGANGVAVLNGLQIISRGTSPPELLAHAAPPGAPVNTNLLFREIHYTGKVTDTEARFTAAFEVESMTTNEISATLFQGDVAVLAPQLPDGLRIVGSGEEFRLFAVRPGDYQVKLELAAKITRHEPWNQISFTGPAAAIASVEARADDGVELQLASGTQVETGQPDAAGSKALSHLQGFLGADRLLSLRWQSKTAEVARKSLVTVDTTATAQITPTVIKFNTQLHYEILQAGAPSLTIALPTGHALTKLQGEQIRDWQIKPDGDRQLLNVEFIKPVEKSYVLTLFSEQPVDNAAQTTRLMPPQPLDAERESGSFTISADEMSVDVDTAAGLRQVNAPKGALASYRFYGRPFVLAAKLKRIEPVLNVADRVTARLEETRLFVSHALTLQVEKAGLYAVELSPGLPVADVHGDGIEDWKMADGKLHVNFASRVLGQRQLEVQLEEPFKQFPEQIAIAPLRVIGAVRETAQIGAAAAPGLQLKTASLKALREIPAATLAGRSDELLAYNADQPDWLLSLGAEKLKARTVAEVFNLVTIGDGLVGGSATIRYGIVNQGVQEFKVKLPAHWKNIEFTGSNIRRKDFADGIWTISLQDKAWDGYTLVVTYDYQFDPKHAVLDAAGAHTIGIERETGSMAITTAASLKLEPKPVAEPLRVIDQSELAETDRAFITRPVLLAYRYTGTDYALQVDVTRHEQLPVLDAVADRTQLTTVLTDAGEMLTEASFMVKNNDKQFQKFKLPGDARLWGCYVNGNPVKAERDGEWLLVSLPHEANRDQAFAVDIKYAQQIKPLKSLMPEALALAAPTTDVPNTYAEWELFVPPGQRLSGFGGTMTVARGTTYGLRDAWDGFLDFYSALIENVGVGAFILISFLVMLCALVWRGSKRGARGLIEALAVLGILVILAGMLLPSLARSKQKAGRISAVNNLKQVDLAAHMFADDNGRLPSSFDEMGKELGSQTITVDPISGEQFNYVGAGKREGDPNAIIAYSPTDRNGRVVAFADGRVETLSSGQFEESLQREAKAYLQGGFGGGQVAGTDRLPARQAESEFRSRGIQNGVAAGPTTGVPAAPSESTHSMGWANSSPPPGALEQQPIPVASSNPADGAAASGQVFPAAAGLRSIRIDIPRIGHEFHFTKVLNVNGEPLAIRMSVVRASVFSMARMALQLTGFLVGLALIWRGRRRGSFWLALGWVLVVVSVGSLLIAHRILHLLFIVIPPVLILLGAVALGKKLFRRRAAEPVISPDVPPALALWFFFFAIALFQPGVTRAEQAAPVVSASDANAVSIVSARYTGTVNDRVAQFDVTLQLSAFGTNETVNLFGEDLAVEQFSAKAGDARLVRDGKSVGVLMPKPGNATLQFKLIAKLSGDVTRRQLNFAIPPALASQFTATIAEPDADVEFPSAVSFQRTGENQETRVEAVLGPASRVEMQWTPRMKRATEVAATVFCQDTSLVTFGGGAVNTRSTLDYQVTQGELRQLRVRLPAGQRLLRVEGDSIRTWELKEAEGNVLVVDLLKGASTNYWLSVETEKALEKLPATFTVETCHALDVKRESGMVAVRGGEELSLAINDTRDLQRVDNAEFHFVEPAGDILSAYRFLNIDFQLSVRAEAVQPEVEAFVRNNARVGPEQIALTATIDYTIKRAGVFSLKLMLPEGYELQSVSGDSVFQSPEPGETHERAVEITLKERTIGACQLRLELVRPLKELPRTIDIVGVRPLDVQKLRGVVAVSAEPGVAIKTGSFDGLAEIPASSLPDFSNSGQGDVLAYKFTAADPSAAAWKLSAATESVESWVRAEVANVITLSDALASGRAVIRYDIQNAPVGEFRLKLPAAFQNIEVTGSNIRRRDQTGEEWRVELQNKVSGTYLLTVTWEQPGNFKTNDLEVTGVQALGAERETGVVAILARPPLQVAAGKASEELVKIDARELPDWAGVGDAAARVDGESVVLSYRYVRPGYKLALEVKRFEDAAVLQALVDNVHLTTVVADDGQMMTEMALGIHNNGRQDLELELPSGATVWSAFVAGQPVRPTRRDGKLLLPLERSSADGAPVSVELTYVNVEKFPRRKGRVDLASPKLDMPLKNARWELYLPPDFEYGKFSGSMTHEVEAAPVYKSFSFYDYSMEEDKKKSARKAEVQNFLSNAREQLAEGKVKELSEAYNQNRGGNYDADASKDLETIGRDLRRAQGENLIKAQQAYSAKNAGTFSFQSADKPSEAARVENNITLNYDTGVAQKQWTKLEQAQELGVVNAQPLRANLPTHGLRHIFTQVLQTEINKPMTIELAATSTKAMSWLGRIFLPLAGFVGLWILVALLPKRQEPAARAG
jgi:hypothetical protein